MIDLTKKGGLPNVVMIDGSPYSIYTDFRVWMRFEIELSNNIHGKEFDVSYLFKNEMPGRCSFQELMVFCRPQSILPKVTKHSNDIVLDYEIDADYIYAAFMSQYGIDLCDIEHLHWHKFLALMKGLKGEVICDIMQYRSYEPQENNKDIYSELKMMWTIEKITPEEQAEMDKFSSYFD